MRPTTETLTRREREIMDILYRLNRATAQEVLAEMADPPSYSAVRTFLRLLEERGHVKHAQEGAKYVYAPIVPRKEAKQRAIQHVVRTFFDGSAMDAVATLVSNPRTKLSSGELDQLADLIEQAKKEGR